MDDQDKNKNKLVDIRHFRQQKGILERDVQAAELVKSAGEAIISSLQESLGRQGRPDLLPRVLAYSINHPSWSKDPTRPSIGNRVANNTVDFVVAMDLGPKIQGLLGLHHHLSRLRNSIESPAEFLVTIPNHGPDLIEAAVLVDKPTFKALVVSSPDKTYLACIDKNGNTLDLHLRVLATPDTGHRLSLLECRELRSRSSLIKAGLLGHMAHDGELSLAYRDAGYLCSIWMDEDVAGGWISAQVYVRYDDLDFVRFVLDELVLQTTREPGNGKN